MRFARWARTVGVAALVIGVVLTGLSLARGIPAAPQDAQVSLAANKPVQTQSFITRVVLVDVSDATRVEPDGRIKCPQGTQTVQLQPSAIVVEGSTVKLEYDKMSKRKNPRVYAIIINEVQTADTKLMGVGSNALLGNQNPNAPDVEFSVRSVYGKVERAELCVPFF